MKQRSLELVVAPAQEPVILSEAKAYLRVDSSSEDGVITNLIFTARSMVEEYLRKSLITQTWKLSYDSSLHEQIFLAMGPIQSVVSVKLISREGDVSTIDPATYYLNASKLCLIFDVTPEAHRIEIEYLAGFGSNPSDVPMAIRQAILAQILAIFDNRDESSMPDKVLSILAPFRSISL